MGELLKQGWHPQRTIIYCFWDGEEEGLLGSTEWAETHEEELRQHAVAYFNSDGNGRGFFEAEGSHSLENFIDGVARGIKDPETGMSIHERAQLHEISTASTEERAQLRTRADAKIPSLGSGSDYSSFVDHVGVASVNLGFGGEDDDGQYHSIYDDFYLYTHFLDTQFVYERALSQTAGTMILRMADADVPPFQFGDLAETIHTYTGEVKKLADTLRTETNERNTEIADGVYKALQDPKKTLVAPAIEPLPPYFNFAPLDQASDNLTAAAAEYDKAVAHAAGAGNAAVDMQLIKAEQALLDPAGLPKRPWYRNMVYAPGLYTGYGVKTLPAVREALEEKQWSEVDADCADSGGDRTRGGVAESGDGSTRGPVVAESRLAPRFGAERSGAAPRGEYHFSTGARLTGVAAFADVWRALPHAEEFEDPAACRLRRAGADGASRGSYQRRFGRERPAGWRSVPADQRVQRGAAAHPVGLRD